MAAQTRGSVKGLVHEVKGSVHDLKDSLEAKATAVLVLAFGQDLEEQFGAASVEFPAAEFVDAEQVDAAVAGDGLGQLPFVSGFDGTL